MMMMMFCLRCHGYNVIIMVHLVWQQKAGLIHVYFRPQSINDFRNFTFLVVAGLKALHVSLSVMAESCLSGSR